MALEPPPQPHHKPSPRHRSCLKAVCLTSLITILLLATTVWFARGWITSKAEAALQAELKKRELHVTYDSTRFSLRNGLVIKNVTLFRDASHSQPFLKLSQVAAAADLRGQISALITTRNATLTIYTGKTEPTFTALTARIRPTSKTLEIEQFDSHFQGLDVEASSRFTFAPPKAAPDPASPGPNPSETERKFDLSQLDLSPLDRLFEFASFKPSQKPPLLTLDINHDASKQSRIIIGNLNGNHFVWRDIKIDSLHLPFHQISKPGIDSLDFDKTNLTYNGQPLAMSARLNLKDSVLAIDELSSSTDIVSLIAQAVPQSAPALQKIKLTTPPTLTASGILPLKSPQSADLKLTVAGKNTITINANGKPLVLENLAGNFTLKNGILGTENLTARLFGGSLKANTSLRPFDKPLKLNTTALSIENAVISQVEQFIGIGTHKGTGGTLSARLNGSGEPSLEGLNATGHVRADGAEFYSIPLYGNLAEIFGKLLPKFNHSEKSALTADLKLNQGTLSTQNLEIHSSGTTIESKAHVNFPKRYLTAHAEARLGGDGLVGAATSLLGKALQIEAQGSFDNIQWKFDNIPGLNSFQSMGDLTTGLGEGTIDLLTGSAGKILDAGNASGDAVKAGSDLLKDSAGGAANAVKGLLKGFGGNKDK